MRLPALLLALLALPVMAEVPPNERLEIALKAYRLAATGYREGNTPQDTVVTWSLRAGSCRKPRVHPTPGPTTSTG